MSAPIIEAAAALRGRTVLVTGGSGFIGCRLVERLVLQHGVRVRVLVRDVARAVRVATFPVELAPGSVLDPAALATAAAGCDTVFHCAYGTAGSQSERARTNREGTRNVLEAALAQRVRRVVCLSTLMVYGHTPDGDLDETAPRRRYGDTYSDSKYDAELVALRMARERGAPVVLLQPTAVYGPYGGVWTELPLRQLASGRVILVNGGDGIANAVAVDDLVSALLLAAVGEGVEGEAFLISGARSESWRDFYGRFERMLGGESRTVAMSEAEALCWWRRHRWRAPSVVAVLSRRLRADAELRRSIARSREAGLLLHAARTLMPEGLQLALKRQAKRLAGRGGAGSAPPQSSPPPVHPLAPGMIEFFAMKTHVRIDKARRALGYEPSVTLDEGMRETEAWARWANLLSPVPPAAERG
jgi:nucleoside-diphosphate-sugar epimerase